MGKAKSTHVKKASEILADIAGEQSAASARSQPATPVEMATNRPYLTVAVIAEKVLIEQDHAPTIVRIISGIGIESEAQQGDVVSLPLTLFLSFRDGGYAGKSVLLIVRKTLWAQASQLEWQKSNSREKKPRHII